MLANGSLTMRGIICIIALATIAAFAQAKFFPNDAVIDITKPPYNAKPDDGIDDTAVVQQAIRDCVGTRKPIFFPAGTYDLSDSLIAKDAAGVWKPMLTLQGESRLKTILNLHDHAAGFADPRHPKPLIQTASLFEPGDDPAGGGNKAFANYVRDLTIDTGVGNAGAVGIDWAVSNWGAIEDVVIRSGDGEGHAGISMCRRIPGPGLIRNVSVSGFDFGIDLADLQYGITIEHLRLDHQKNAGIHCRDNLLHIRDLQSVNDVPAIITAGANSMLVLLDSTFNGSAGDAMRLEGSHLVVHAQMNPPASIQVNGKTIAPTETWTNAAPMLGRPLSLPREAMLPVEDAPSHWYNNPADWCAVGLRREGESDDTAAIQRAIDSGKPVVYFPVGRTYYLSDTVVIRGRVRMVVGCGSEISLGAAKKPFGDASHLRPLFRIEPVDGEDVTFDNLFFNAQYPGELLFDNDSSKTLIIRHTGGWVGSKGFRHAYDNTSRATGKVFIEDAFLPGWMFSAQAVFARQLNPENPDTESPMPQVLNSGGTLWILGFKTEGPAPFIQTILGGTTNLFGGYNYVSATAASAVPARAVPYITSGGRSILSFTTDNFRNSDYDIYLSDTSGQTPSQLRRAEMPPRNGVAGDRSFVMPFYDSAAPHR